LIRSVNVRAFELPMSHLKKGCRPRLASLTISSSTTVTSSERDEIARSAVSSEASPISICAPLPPQPTSTILIARLPSAAGR
jgi:hypothetical protein